MSSFVVAIEVGNSAMEKPGQVATALREVADKLEGGQLDGGVVDLNGNKVGTFTFPSEALAEEDLELAQPEAGVVRPDGPETAEGGLIGQQPY